MTKKLIPRQICRISVQNFRSVISNHISTYIPSFIQFGDEKFFWWKKSQGVCIPWFFFDRFHQHISIFLKMCQNVACTSGSKDLAKLIPNCLLFWNAIILIAKCLMKLISLSIWPIHPTFQSQPRPNQSIND